LNGGFHHHPFESPAKLLSVSNRSAHECPAGHVPRIYCCPGEEQIDAHMCLPTWTCFPFGSALLGHNDQTWSWIKWKPFFCSMEEEGFRLGADSVVTVPLAGVTPGPDNTERGDDTDSTSDICYIGSDTSSDAGDIPNDTLSANEDGSHVPQRWAAFLKNTKQVVEAELRDMHNRHVLLFQHLVAQGCLHILFGADNTSRNTFISEAEKAEQGVLKILFPHVPSCQQSPRLTIPQFIFEGPEDYSTLFNVLNKLQRNSGFPSKVQVQALAKSLCIWMLPGMWDPI
jgi:hypothetical protein